MSKCFGHKLIQVGILYLASRILRILRVEIIALLDSGHLSTYKLIKDSSGLTVLYVIDIKSELLMSTIGAEHPIIWSFATNYYALRKIYIQ